MHLDKYTRVVLTKSLASILLDEYVEGFLVVGRVPTELGQAYKWENGQHQGRVFEVCNSIKVWKIVVTGRVSIV